MTQIEPRSDAKCTFGPDLRLRCTFRIIIEFPLILNNELVLVLLQV